MTQPERQAKEGNEANEMTDSLSMCRRGFFLWRKSPVPSAIEYI